MDAASRCSRERAVAAQLDRLAALGGPVDSPELSAGLTYARAVLAVHEVADARFSTALEDPLIHDRPFLLGRLLLAQGARRRRERRRRQARDPLRIAHDLFDQLGAEPWRERTEQELRASAENRRLADHALAHELTPQEHEIARLAAAGLSNREIAQRLSVSPRTVGTHLYRVFYKLDIGSRNELTACSALTGATLAA